MDVEKVATSRELWGRMKGGAEREEGRAVTQLLLVGEQCRCEKVWESGPAGVFSPGKDLRKATLESDYYFFKLIYQVT